jgi:hypothetical protein
VLRGKRRQLNLPVDIVRITKSIKGFYAVCVKHMENTAAAEKIALRRRAAGRFFLNVFHQPEYKY